MNDQFEADDAYDLETIVDDDDVDVIIEDEDEDGENVEIDYGSDTEEVEDINQTKGVTERDVFGDISDISSDSEDEYNNTVCASPRVKFKIDRKEYISDVPMNDNKVFDTLDPDEKKYLPLNYIVSPMMEWKFIQEACASGFRSVSNLIRVSNKTIRQIANISQYTLDNGTAKIPKLNQAFIDYAAQRGGVGTVGSSTQHQRGGGVGTVGSSIQPQRAEGVGTFNESTQPQRGGGVVTFNESTQPQRGGGVVTFNESTQPQRGGLDTKGVGTFNESTQPQRGGLDTKGVGTFNASTKKKTCVDCKTTLDAAGNGHLDCLTSLHEQGCQWDERTCAYAARYGRLKCLKYAHEKGCPWDESICFWAAKYDHIDCLKYAHENDCPCEHFNKTKTKKYNVSLDEPSKNIDDKCYICLENIQKVQYKPCNHMFCITCTNRLINDAATADAIAAAIAATFDDIVQNKKIKCVLCLDEVEETVLLDN